MRAKGLAHSYWQSAAWLAVSSFPVFVRTVPLADPLTVLLFGQRYEASGTVLLFLSLGFYVNAALGFNQQILQIYGRARWVISVNLATAVVNVVLCFASIPDHGGRWRGPRQHDRPHPAEPAQPDRPNPATRRRRSSIGRTGPSTPRSRLAGLGLWAVVEVLAPPDLVAFALAALTSVALLVTSRSTLRIGETFPELTRMPVILRLTR